MSNSCQSCKQKINKAEMNQAFVFSLGELINGAFIERETYHYHVECLNYHKPCKRKKKAVLQV